MTLAEKVTAVLMLDDNGEGAISRCHTSSGLDTGPDFRWSEYELDLLDWGLVYGIAFGIARTEETFESVESCAARAVDAAKLAWERYAGGRRLERPEAVA